MEDLHDGTVSVCRMQAIYRAVLNSLFSSFCAFGSQLFWSLISKRERGTWN